MAAKLSLVDFFKKHGAAFSERETRGLFERLNFREEQIEMLFADFEAVRSRARGWNIQEFLLWLEAAESQGPASSPIIPGAGPAGREHRPGPKKEANRAQARFQEVFFEEMQAETERVAARVEASVEERLRDGNSASLSAEDEATLREQVRRTDARSHPAWKMEDAFSEAISMAVISNLRRALAPDCPENMEIAFARALARGSPELISSALQEQQTLRAIGGTLHQIAQKVSATEAATGAELNDKFCTSSDRGFAMDFGSKVDFFEGLEALVGSPDPRLLESMTQEHCGHCDSSREWTTGNYGITTTSSVEYMLVSKEVIDQCAKDVENSFPLKWHDVADQLKAAKAPLPPLSEWPTEWPKETKHANLGRNAQTQHFLHQLLEKNLELRGLGERDLLIEEGMMIRLYTGPLFEKYNAVARGGALAGSPNKFLESRFRSLCCDDEEENRYCTSIHVLNSGVVKLSKLTKVATVYRGLGGNVLPQQFWEEDVFGCKGGVEYGFMSTTLDRETAMRYAGDGSVKMVLQIETGSIDRGASLEALSQYPHEKEILFPPLASLEVLKTGAVGGVLVVHTRVNVNLRSPTIEEVIATRFKILTMMRDANKIEAKYLLRSPRWKSLLLDEASVPEPILAAFRSVVEAKMSAILSNEATHYNEDTNFLSAVEQMVQVAAEMRLQRSSLLRHVGSELGDSRLLELADEREEMEVVRQRRCFGFTAKTAGMGKFWLFRALGFQKSQDGCYYPADESMQFYRDVLLRTVPVASAGTDLPRGRALLAANGRRDLEQWALEVQEAWRSETSMEMDLELCAPRSNEEFNDVLIAKLVMDTRGNIANYLLSNNHQEELDLNSAFLSDAQGQSLCKALQQTGGRLALELLILSNNDLGPGFARALAKALAAGALPRLRLLQLVHNPTMGTDQEVTTELLSALGQNCDSLEALNMAGCGIQDASADASDTLSTAFGKLFQRMKSLQLYNNEFGPGMAAVISSGLRAAATTGSQTNSQAATDGTTDLPLRFLWLVNNPNFFEGSTEGPQHFLESLSHCTSLEELRLANTGLAGLASIEALGRATPKWTKLRELTLYGNPKLCDEDPERSRALFGSLQGCSSLEDLRLFETGLCQAAAAAALALQSFGKLKILSWEDNPKFFAGGDLEGTKAFFKSLDACPDIEHVELTDTGLAGTADTFAPLVEVLPKISKLSVLLLNKNDGIDEDAKVAIRAAVEPRRQVKNFDI